MQTAATLSLTLWVVGIWSTHLSIRSHIGAAATLTPSQFAPHSMTPAEIAAGSGSQESTCPTGTPRISVTPALLEQSLSHVMLNRWAGMVVGIAACVMTCELQHRHFEETLHTVWCSRGVKRRSGLRPTVAAIGYNSCCASSRAGAQANISSLDRGGSRCGKVHAAPFHIDAPERRLIRSRMGFNSSGRDIGLPYSVRFPV